MPVQVRELTQGEGLVWRDLRLNALAESPDAFAVTYADDAGRPDASWHRMIDATAADPDSTSFVTEIDGTPVGMAYCRLHDRDASVGQLFAMWVDPRFRGRGVGRSLVDSALKWMRERGASSAELTVTGTNRPALHLYESNGFVDTGERDTLREGSDLQVIRMRCELSSDGSPQRLVT